MSALYWYTLMVVCVMLDIHTALTSTGSARTLAIAAGVLCFVMAIVWGFNIVSALKG